MGLAQFQGCEFNCVASLFKFDSKKILVFLKNFSYWASEGHVQHYQLVMYDLVVLHVLLLLCVSNVSFPFQIC